MRVLCLLDSPLRPGDRWLWNYLPEARDQVRFMVAQSGGTFSARPIGRLRRYAHYYQTGRMAAEVAAQDNYDIVVAWENKNGLPLLLARWLNRHNAPPAVLLTFALKPALEEFRGAVKPWLHYNAYFTAPSQWEAQSARKEFGLSARQMSVCYLGGYDVLAHVRASRISDDPSINAPFFSGGITGRDYQTLWTAFEGAPVRCIVNAPGALTNRLPQAKNIEAHELLPADQYFRQLMASRAVILPLVPREYAAGLSVALNAMSAGRPVICTNTPVLTEYVTDGVTGLLVPPSDPNKLRDAIMWMARNPQEAEAMGQAARRCYLERFTFEQFAVRIHQRLEEVAGGG